MVDTWTRFIDARGGSSHDPNDVSSSASFLERYAKDCPVIILDHTVRDRANQGFRASGSSKKAESVDVVIAIERNPRGGDSDTRYPDTHMSGSFTLLKDRHGLLEQTLLRDDAEPGDRHAGTWALTTDPVTPTRSGPAGTPDIESRVVRIVTARDYASQEEKEENAAAVEEHAPQAMTLFIEKLSADSRRAAKLDNLVASGLGVRPAVARELRVLAVEAGVLLQDSEGTVSLAPGVAESMAASVEDDVPVPAAAPDTSTVEDDVPATSRTSTNAHPVLSALADAGEHPRRDDLEKALKESTGLSRDDARAAIKDSIDTGLVETYPHPTRPRAKAYRPINN